MVVPAMITAAVSAWRIQSIERPAIALPAPWDERILQELTTEDHDERATGNCHP
jgi:hypothetical protein